MDGRLRRAGGGKPYLYCKETVMERAIDRTLETWEYYLPGFALADVDVRGLRDEVEVVVLGVSPIARNRL